MKTLIKSIIVLLVVGFSLTAMAQQPMEPVSQILFESDFEQTSAGQAWPGGWSKPVKGSWEKEDGNRFLRLTSTLPDEMVLLYKEVHLPQGTEALLIKWKQRVTGLAVGAQSWYDARLIFEYMNANRELIAIKPKAIATAYDTNGWVEKETMIQLPSDARILKFMPTLFRVQAGNFDVDDIVIQSVKASEGINVTTPETKSKLDTSHFHLREVPEMNNWPLELKVSGNRLNDPNGNDVWLQGVNVASLEWNRNGEHILRSIIEATENWNVNVIRLPVQEDFWFEEQGGEAYQQLIDDAITIAANRGAYTVLDLHRYRAPRQVHVEFWKSAAARYSNHPAVLFDVLNEPHGISWDVWLNGGFVQEKTKLADEDIFLSDEERLANAQGFHSPGIKALVDAIREIGAKNVVVVGGLDWAYDLSGILNGYAIEDPIGNGVVYSTHVYPWKQNWEESFLKVAEVHPILLGEVGVDIRKMRFVDESLQEDAETWAPAILGLIQKYRLNWTAWCFHPKAAPRMLEDWDYTYTPYWGKPAKEALFGKPFELSHYR